MSCIMTNLKCDARKLPKWLVDYLRSRLSKSLSDPGDQPDDEVSVGGSSKTDSTFAKDPEVIATEERLRKQLE